MDVRRPPTRLFEMLPAGLAAGRWTDAKALCDSILYLKKHPADRLCPAKLTGEIQSTEDIDQLNRATDFIRSILR